MFLVGVALVTALASVYLPVWLFLLPALLWFICMPVCLAKKPKTTEESGVSQHKREREREREDKQKTKKTEKKLGDTHIRVGVGC